MVAGKKGRPRLAVGGARRVRQGTGPFLALHAAGLGAPVVAVLGRSAATAAEAAAWLAERGVPTEPCVALEDCARIHGVDALVIASPIGCHEALLEEAVGLGLHVLCEKPLLAAPESLGGSAARARALASRFAARGLLLRENCQWPFTLDDFRALHPEARLGEVTRFRMEMTPPHAGLDLLLEVLSHPISLLQAVCPGEVELEDTHFEEWNAGPGRSGLALRFAWRSGERQLDCRLRFVDRGVFPRPVSYGFDEFSCHRAVREPGYRISFRDRPEDDRSPAREVAAADPMRSLLAAWLQEIDAVRSGESRARADPELVQRQELLEELALAWRTVHA